MFRMRRGGLSLGTTCPGPGSGLRGDSKALLLCWAQCPGNQSPLCTSSTIINQSSRGAASVQFSLSSPNTIHKLAFMQGWSCTGMKPHLTAQAPRATWFWVELIAKRTQVFETPKNQELERITALGPHRRASKHFCVKSQHLTKPFLAHISLLTPLFLPWNFHFPIRNLMTERSQGEELGCAIPNMQVSIYCFTE